MTERRVPAELLSAVKRDLQRVRPLATPARRALSLLPLGIVLLIVLPVFWRWCTRSGELAPWPSWGLSALESAAGLATVAVGFREAIPGRGLARTTLVGLIGVVWLGFLAVNAATQMPMPGAVSRETNVQWIRECVGMATAFSVPVLAVVGWLVARALPHRPVWTGALCGLGVGMMADAGLRLVCRDGELAHIVVAHGGAIAIVMVLGAISAYFVERIKARR
jgi:hypothetical protein